MFTGLVADLGRIASVARSEEGVRLTIESRLVSELGEGDSVAVNGVCLTAVAVGDGCFAADVINATLERSSLDSVQMDDPVNLELPLRATDRLGGHLVQGHVDGVGEIVESSEDGFARRVRISAAPEVLRYVVSRGSVAVDGVSLTVVDLDEASFTVSLIPETLERTTLSRARAGTRVNLEVDVLAKYVEKLVGAAQ